MTASDTFCSVCGALLSHSEIAARIEGHLTDYEARDDGEMTVILCSECRAALMEISKGGMKAARRRQREYRTVEGRS